MAILTLDQGLILLLQSLSATLRSKAPHTLHLKIVSLKLATTLASCSKKGPDAGGSL